MTVSRERFSVWVAVPVHLGEDRGHVLGGEAMAAQVHLPVACREPGCRSVWYDLPHEPGGDGPGAT